MNDKKEKFWLVFMAGPNSLQDLKELIEPVKNNFDGIVAVYHGRDFDDEATYLESVKGDGEIIYTKFVKRHDFSRNHYLFCGPIKPGDWCCQIDVLERLNTDFAKSLRDHLEFFKRDSVNMVYYYNKPFVFQFHESLQYFGNPHEGLRRQDGKGAAIEFAAFMPTEAEVRFNIRPLKRPDKYHFVNHYVKYYLYPWGSNHCLLGLEKNGNPQELFPARDARRIKFREILSGLGVELTVDGLLQYIKSGKMDPNITKAFNEEKILNDFWRYHILNDREFNDDHNFKNMVKI